MIAIRYFVPLSKHIVGCQPAIPVPESIAASLRRAIKLRGEFGGLLEKHGYNLVALADREHEHFIGVLAKVYNILQPRFVFTLIDAYSDGAPTNSFRMSFNTSSLDNQENACESSNDLTNYFERLSVEEPSESFPKTPDVPLDDPRSQEEGRIQYITEPQISLEDASFAKHQVFRDINTIRRTTASFWDRFFNHETKINRVPLTAAALVTSLGIDLVRDLIDDITPLCDKYGGIYNLPGESCQEPTDITEPSEEQIPKSQSTEDQFIMPLYVLNYLQKELPGNENTSINTYDFDSDAEVEISLLSWLYLESLMIGMEVGPVTEDEITKGMRIFRDTPKAPIPFHLVYAGQVFLDLSLKYQEKTTRAFDIMIQQLVHKQSELQNFMEFQELNPIYTGGLNEKVQEALRSLTKLLDATISDEQFDERVNFYRLHGLPPPGHRHEFLRKNPILCGLNLLFYQAQIQGFGIDIMNHDQTIICGSHLHNALGKENLLNTEWVDMELVVHTFHMSNLFVGEEAPTGADNYYRNYLLHLGMPISYFAANPRRLVEPKMTPTRRKIPKGAEVLRMFVDKYTNDKKGSAPWTRSFLESILDKCNIKEVERDDNGDQSFTQVQFMTSDEVSDELHHKIGGICLRSISHANDGTINRYVNETAW